MPPCVLYLAKPIYGGWVSFTAHLSLKTGFPVFKLSNRTETHQRPFGYGVMYRNLSSVPPKSVIAALDKHYYSLLPSVPDGTWIVIHDYTELTPTVREHLGRLRVITIRKKVQALIPGSLFLHHPFFPFPLLPRAPKRPLCLSRLDYDKNIELILEANRLGADITLWGFLNRLYAHHKLKNYDVNSSYRGAFPKSFGRIAELLSEATALVDMSIIKNDGGGSQYTLLEAIHAGVPLVLHKKWVDVSGSVWVDGENCLSVESPEELVKALATPDKPLASELLQRHISEDWASILTKEYSMG